MINLRRTPTEAEKTNMNIGLAVKIQTITSLHAQINQEARELSIYRKTCTKDLEIYDKGIRELMHLIELETLPRGSSAKIVSELKRITRLRRTTINNIGAINCLIGSKEKDTKHNLVPNLENFKAPCETLSGFTYTLIDPITLKLKI